MLEQRRYQRSDFSEPVQYRRIPGHETTGCLACDYSSGGIRLQSQKFIPLNTNLFLDFMSPKREHRQVTGKVVWVQRVPYIESYQFGVALAELAPAEAQ